MRPTSIVGKLYQRVSRDYASANRGSSPTPRERRRIRTGLTHSALRPVEVAAVSILNSPREAHNNHVPAAHCSSDIAQQRHAKTNAR